MTRSDDALALRSAVFEDRDLPWRLKLFILAAIHVWETGPERRKLKQFRWEHWALRAFRLTGETGTDEELWGRIRWMIRDDVPKFRPDLSGRGACLGTMLRPAGAPCARRTTMQTTIPNPMTGERTLVGSCSDKRHQQQTNAQIKAAWDAWRANGEPQPKPNSGGLLLRYFTSGIEPLYAWADEDYNRGDKVPEPPEQKLAAVISITDRMTTKGR